MNYVVEILKFQQRYVALCNGFVYELDSVPEFYKDDVDQLLSVWNCTRREPRVLGE